MRYLPIDNTLFIENRKKFTAQLPPGSVAILHSNDIMPTNADGVRPFIQDSYLFWLTGIDQEESICVLFPDSPEKKQREMLFLKQTSEHIAIWEGHKYTKQEATDTSGIPNVFWLSPFENVLVKLMSETEVVYIPSELHTKQNTVIPTANIRFVHRLKEKFPLKPIVDASPILNDLRLRKSPIEVELMKRACDITETGFRRVLEFVKPGVWEFEIEAEYAGEFIRNRARGFAYEPIIASGKDSCVLHYVANDKQCQSGDILLMDVGASYANYASDMTRTIPVNGKFTKRQKEVYNAVHTCLKEAIKIMTAGMTQSDYNEQVAQIVEKELVDLNLITTRDIRDQDPKRPAYLKYFMHKTAHSIGLDVHDVGDRYTAFESGMVFTCEPGIYIREENIGVRLENDILITDNGNVDLMKSIPIDADEIEDLMNGL